MRIAKDKIQLITEAPTSRFLLVIDAMDGEVLMKKEGKTLISIALDANDSVVARITTPKETVTLKGKNARHKEIILTASYARFGLYVGGLLLDEEFFFAPLDYKDSEITAGSYMHFEAGYEYHSMAESGVVENVAQSFNGFLPPYGNDMAIVRAVPCAMRERLHVFYLDERRRGKAKAGMGANRVCCVFSDKSGSIHTAPIALPIDSMEEKRMCSFSPITVDGRTYLYYTVDYRAGRALSCAVSDDGFSYAKTGLDVEIPQVDHQTVESVYACVYDGTPNLFFTAQGKAYRAKSIDLLHFEAPIPLAFADGIEHLYVTHCGERTLFVGEMDGATVYCFGEGDAWKRFPISMKQPRPVAFEQELLAFGTEGGALACAKLSLVGNLLTAKHS